MGLTHRTMWSLPQSDSHSQRYQTDCQPWGASHRHLDLKSPTLCLLGTWNNQHRLQQVLSCSLKTLLLWHRHIWVDYGRISTRLAREPGSLPPPCPIFPVAPSYWGCMQEGSTAAIRWKSVSMDFFSYFEPLLWKIRPLLFVCCRSSLPRSAVTWMMNCALTAMSYGNIVNESQSCKHAHLVSITIFRGKIIIIFK